MPDLGKLGVPKYASGQPYHYDVYVSPSQRNTVLEEVAKEIEKFTAFGPDTIGSFAVYIRGMKK